MNKSSFIFSYNLLYNEPLSNLLNTEKIDNIKLHVHVSGPGGHSYPGSMMEMDALQAPPHPSGPPTPHHTEPLPLMSSHHALQAKTGTAADKLGMPC